MFLLFRKEYSCVMKWLLKEQGDFGPFYIGLKADSNDHFKNMFEWDHPMSEYDYIFVFKISLLYTETIPGISNEN